MSKQILPLDQAIVAASTICTVLKQKPTFNNKLKTGRTIKWYYAERPDCVKAHKLLKKVGITTEITESGHYAPVFGIKFTTVDEFSIREHCPKINTQVAKEPGLTVDQQIDILTRDQLVHVLKQCKLSADTLTKRLRS